MLTTVFESDKEAQEFFQYWRDLKQWSDETTIAWMTLNPYQVKEQVEVWRNRPKRTDKEKREESNQPTYALDMLKLDALLEGISREWTSLTQIKISNILKGELDGKADYINIETLISSIQDGLNPSEPDEGVLTPLALSIIKINEYSELFTTEMDTGEGGIEMVPVHMSEKDIKKIIINECDLDIPEDSIPFDEILELLFTEYEAKPRKKVREEKVVKKVEDKKEEPLYYLNVEHLVDVVEDIQGAWNNIKDHRLGMAIDKHIASAHGDYIDVDNLKSFIMGQLDSTPHDNLLTPMSKAILILDENMDDIFTEGPVVIKFSLGKLEEVLIQEIGIQTEAGIVERVINEFFVKVPKDSPKSN